MNLDIKDCVTENTGPNEPSIATATALVALMQNEAVRDEVYLEIMKSIQHITLQQHKENNVQSRLLRCLRLLKTKVIKYPPLSLDTAIDMDAFCKDLMDKVNHDAVLKQIKFLRVLIVKRAKVAMDRTSGRKMDAVEEGGYAASTSHNKAVASPSAVEKSLKADRVANLGKYSRAVENWLLARSHEGVSIPPKKKIRALLNCNLFGGYLMKQGAIDVSAMNCVLFNDWEGLSSSAAAIAEMKRKERNHTSALSADPTPNQIPYYVDQESLALSMEQLDLVIDTLLIRLPVDKEDSEMKAQKEKAAQIFIKFVMDLYCCGDVKGTHYTLVVFAELLETKDRGCQVLAFDLLYNLAVHTVFLEGASVEQSEGMTRLHAVRADLFKKLTVLTGWICDLNLNDNVVLSSALRCILYFACCDGHMDSYQLEELDGRFWTAICQNRIALKETELMLVIRGVLHYLYPTGSPILNMVRLKQFGGIAAVLDLYTTVRTPEAQDNLFLVLYDFIVRHLAYNKQIEIPQDQIVLILQFLKSLDVPKYLHQIFILVPEHFVEQFVRFIYIEQLKKDPEWCQAFQDLDKAMLVAVLFAMERLAQAYSKIPEELDAVIQKSMTEFTDEHKDVLKSFLMSSFQEEQRLGTIWLFRLMMDPSESFRDTHGAFVDSILSEGHPPVHLGYMKAAEMVLFQMRSVVALDPESRSRFTEAVNRLLLRKLEKMNGIDRDNLLEMYRLITSVLFIPASDRTRYEPLDPNILGTCDFFLRGCVVAQRDLLHRLDAKCIRDLFDKLSYYQNQDARKASYVLLTLLVDMSQLSSMLDSIGGMAFFKELVTHSDPFIAHLASDFMRIQLSAEKPQQFQMVVQRLSQRLNISVEELESNAYLLVRSIMDMSKSRS